MLPLFGTRRGFPAGRILLRSRRPSRNPPSAPEPCAPMDDQLRLAIDDSSNLKSLWDDTLDLVERQIGREAVESWLQDAIPASLEEGTLVLHVPNATAKAWVDKKYARKL